MTICLCGLKSASCMGNYLVFFFSPFTRQFARVDTGPAPFSLFFSLPKRSANMVYCFFFFPSSELLTTAFFFSFVRAASFFSFTFSLRKRGETLLLFFPPVVWAWQATGHSLSAFGREPAPAPRFARFPLPLYHGTS